MFFIVSCLWPLRRMVNIKAGGERGAGQVVQGFVHQPSDVKASPRFECAQRWVHMQAFAQHVRMHILQAAFVGSYTK